MIKTITKLFFAKLTHFLFVLIIPFPFKKLIGSHLQIISQSLALHQHLLIFFSVQFEHPNKKSVQNQGLFQHNEIAILMRYFEKSYQITTTMMELLTISLNLCDIIFVFFINIFKKYFLLYSCVSCLLHIFPADQLPEGRLLRN